MTGIMTGKNFNLNSLFIVDLACLFGINIKSGDSGKHFLCKKFSKTTI
jgi:hypothetical protein